MPRGRAWTQQEISCLLALIKGSGQVTLLMASTSRPNEGLWREISQGLAAAGYGRNVAQCRSKWKALKQAFYSEWETCLQAGSHSPRVPPHYKTMKKIWKAAGRPVFGERRLPEVVKLPPGKRRPRLEAQPPSSPDAGPPFAPVPTLDGHRAFATEPETAEQETADSPAVSQAPSGPGVGERALPGTVRDQSSPETTAGGEQPLLGTQASTAGLQGPGAVSLLHSMQQLLVQILHTSRQQQELLESLASDTVSHLHLISDNLVQVGETLQELLLQAHARSADLPASLHHYLGHTPRSPCTPDLKGEPLVAPASGFWPQHRTPP